jgi:hypothetical protein
VLDLQAASQSDIKSIEIKPEPVVIRELYDEMISTLELQAA